MSVSNIKVENWENLYASKLKLISTITASSSSTGALIVNGGIGCNHINCNTLSASNIYATNETILNTYFVTSTADSTSCDSGAVQIDGGIGVNKNCYIGGEIHSINTTESTSSTNGSFVILGGAGIMKNLNIGGSATINVTTESSNISTGALIVSGGLGCSNIFTNSLNCLDEVIRSTVFSTSSSTGALIVNGGVGIMSNLNVGGSLTSNGLVFNGTTESTSVTTGVFVISGGSGIGKNLNVGGNENVSGDLHVLSTTASNSTSTGSLLVNGGMGIAGNANFAQNLNVNTETIISTNESTNYLTGSLLCCGGCGITKNLNVNGNLKITSTTASNSITNGALVVNGGLGIGGDVNIGTSTSLVTINSLLDCKKDIHCGLSVYTDSMCPQTNGFGGQLSVIATTESLNAYNGSLITAGGMGIAKNLNVGGNENVSGSLSVLATTVSSSTSTGALVVSGGVGITGDVNIGTSTSLVTINSLLDCKKDIHCGLSVYTDSICPQTNGFGGRVSFIGTQDAVNAFSGSVTLAGGLGVAKQLYCGQFTSIVATQNMIRVKSNSGVPCGMYLGPSDSVGTYMYNYSDNSFRIGLLPITYDSLIIQPGVVTFPSTIESTSVGSGAIIIPGGASIAKNLYVGGTIHGGVSVSLTTESTSVTTGALIVPGGMGLSKNLFMSGVLNDLNTTDSSSIVTGCAIFSGGVGIAKKLYAGVVTCSSISAGLTTESTNTSTGSLVCGGGAGIAKNLNVGGNVTVTNGSGIFLGGITNSSLGKYEYVSFSFPVGGAISSSNLTGYYVQIGAQVTMFIDAFTKANETNASIYTASGTIPTRFQPASTTYGPILVYNNAMFQGLMKLSTDGTIEIKPGMKFDETFDDGGTTGWVKSSFTYVLT